MEELGCSASLNVDLDAQGPEFWEQYETRGEGIEALVVLAAEMLGEQLRQEYDQRDVITERVKALGE